MYCNVNEGPLEGPEPAAALIEHNKHPTVSEPLHADAAAAFVEHPTDSSEPAIDYRKL